MPKMTFDEFVYKAKDVAFIITTFVDGPDIRTVDPYMFDSWPLGVYAAIQSYSAWDNLYDMIYQLGFTKTVEKYRMEFDCLITIGSYDHKTYDKTEESVLYTYRKIKLRDIYDFLVKHEAL